jgi:amino acid transporter
VAAGAAALGSAFDGAAPFILPISVGFVVLIAAINLKGVKESGLIFAVPTYFFIVNMVLLAGVGFYKLATGGLTEHPMPTEGVIPVDGGIENVIFYGAGLWIVLSAFASGGAAVTGVEAISNGVPAFREPAWKNARDTLIIMGFVAGAMFFTVSFFAAKTHAFPFESGTPTVISQVGEFVYGSGGLGNVLYYGLQAGTMLILVLAANTSFADFPRLASFHAEDNFMPRQLTKRGHRLVFSNGILTLAAAAIFLLIVTDAQVDRLIPLYAIGVFLSFTLSQSGMAKHHLTKKEPGWQKGIVINGIGAFLSAVVCAIIAATKFTSGAWAIIVLIPILVVLLLRLNRQYEREAEVLAEDAAGVAQAPTVTRQVVIVMVDELDVASAKAIQYARSLNPDELLAVHFDLDPVRTEDLTRAWSRLGFDRLALDVVACPDRRLVRGAAEVVARQLLTPGTQVSVLLPRREYSRFWHRLVHDRTADSIAKTLSTLPQTNVTIVPFQVDAGPEDLVQLSLPAAATEVATANGGTRSRKRAKRAAPADLSDMRVPDDRIPIADLTFRQRATVVGKVYSMRVQPWSGVASLELTVVDDTGALLVVFFGRRHLAGVNTGTRLVVKGTIGEHRSTMAMLNPRYDIQLPPGVGEPPPTHG